LAMGEGAAGKVGSLEGEEGFHAEKAEEKDFHPEGLSEDCDRNSRKKSDALPASPSKLAMRSGPETPLSPCPWG
jgi:hypothetical protein